MRGSGESGHVGAYHGEDRLCRVLPDAGNLRQELHKLLHVSGEVVIYDGIYLIDPLVEILDVLKAYSDHLPLHRRQHAVEVVCKLFRRRLEAR